VTNTTHVLVSQAELADELAVNYQKRLAYAENEIRVYRLISQRYIRYREDLEELHKTHADMVVKKASLHRLCCDLAPRSFRQVKDITIGFVHWGVGLLISHRSLIRANKEEKDDRVTQLEDFIANLGIEAPTERKPKKQRTDQLGIGAGHQWTEETTKDLKTIAGLRPGQRLAALENLRETEACEKELTRQFIVRQNTLESLVLPEHFK
jgi:hypothetical protein